MVKAETSYSEDLRQLEHLAPIGFAFLIRFLSWHQALACAILAVLYSLISARFFTLTRRPDETLRGFSSGKLGYGLSILFLILLFPGQKFIVVAAWANLSVGDSVASLVGRNFGRASLPWNPEKTWMGLAGAFISSTFAAFVLISWVGLPVFTRNSGTLIWVYALATSLVCSIVETLPLPLNDNVSIPLAGGAFLSWLSRASIPAGFDVAALALGMAISAAAALPAFLLRTVSVQGALSGILIGSITYAALGLPAFLLLGIFFVLGSLFSKIGYSEKARLGSAEANSGRRSAPQVWGKGGAMFLAAVASLFLPSKTPMKIAFAAAAAAALCDTTATELGQLWGKRAYLLAPFKKAERGTRGAVSLEGSLAGTLAALAIGVAASGLHIINPGDIIGVTGAAVIATHIESLLIAQSGARKASGPLVNALHTILAMLIALLLTGLTI